MNFCGYEVVDNYYKEKKVITSIGIAEITGLKMKQVSDMIAKAKESYLSAGTDYFIIHDKAEVNNINGLNPRSNYPRGVNLITEEGFKRISGVIRKKLAEHNQEVDEKKVVPIRTTTTETKIESPETVELPKFNVVSSEENTTIVEMCKLMSKFMDTCTDLIKQQGEYNKELCTIVHEMMRSRQCNSVAQTKEDNSINISTTIPTEYQVWKKEINRAVDCIVDASGRERNSILSECYKLLTKEYGTCWEQYKKEFYQNEGRYSNSTLELEYWIETHNSSCRNLMLAKLNTMYKEAMS